MSKSWIIHDCKYEQSCFNSENFAYSKSPLLKLRAVEPAVSFQRFLHGSPEQNTDRNISNVNITYFRKLN